MRNFFVSKTDIHRVELEDGQWIDILAQCSHKTRKRATAAMMKSNTSLSDEKDASATKDVQFSLDFDAGAYSDVLLKEMVVDWSFTDDVGTKVEITAENIDNLVADISQIVIKEINRLNPTEAEPGKNEL